MTKSTKNQAVKLSNVVVLDEKSLKAIAKGEVRVGKTTHTVDRRKDNPGRPVNKKSARYKRLAKQAKYALALFKFTQGVKFQLNKEKNQTYKYSVSADSKYGCIVDASFGGHVCNIDYLGRTKATGYTFVLDKRVNVELNLKTLVFVSK